MPDLPLEFLEPGVLRVRASVAAERLGHAMQVLLATDRRLWRIASMQAFVEPPAQLGQIEFLMSSHGRAMAYATWAFLTPEVERDFIGNPTRVLDLEEWNEGTSFWLMDIVAPAGGVQALLQRVRTRLPLIKEVNWRRTDALGSVYACRARLTAQRQEEAATVA